MEDDRFTNAIILKQLLDFGNRNELLAKEARSQSKFLREIRNFLSDRIWKDDEESESKVITRNGKRHGFNCSNDFESSQYGWTSDLPKHHAWPDS